MFIFALPHSNLNKTYSFKYERSSIQPESSQSPTRDNNIYTLQLQHDNSMHQFTEDKILDHDPYIHPENDPAKNNYFPNWLKHGSNITIKLDSSNKYQHSTLQKVNDQYFFRPGRSEKNHSTHLPNFSTRALYLIRDLLLVKGHPTYKKIRDCLHSRHIGDMVANHVSAANLSSHDVPTLIQHKRLKASDRLMKYEELANLPTWVTINEAEY